jgi:hypothetical protein
MERNDANFLRGEVHRPHHLGRWLREQVADGETRHSLKDTHHRSVDSILQMESIERPDGTNEVLQYAFGFPWPYVTRMAFAFPPREDGNSTYVFKEALALYAEHLLKGRERLVLPVEGLPRMRSDLISIMELMKHPGWYESEGIQTMLERGIPLEKPIIKKYQTAAVLHMRASGDTPDQIRANESAIVLLSTFVFGSPIPLNDLNLQYRMERKSEQHYRTPMEFPKNRH